ncbi:MAG: potassium channel protein [Betaproteobacteria bacterium]|nr:potassium channel protein [Betaproteobacteria bacterium]
MHNQFRFLVARAYRTFRYPAAGFVLVMIIGTAGYWHISGGKATLVDCAYMTFITVATIGYGEIIDLSASPGGRVFTMVIGFFGVANLTYMISKMAAFIVESDLNEELRRRRMLDKIARLAGHYIICGMGRVGSNVAHELTVTKRPFVAIDDAQAALELFKERYPDALALHGDASGDDMLLSAGIAKAAGIFAITGDDGRNLMITLAAKQLNPAVRVVARCHEVRSIDKLKRVGADAIVSPDFTGGMRIASSMLRPTVVSFLDEMLRTDDRLRVEEVEVPVGLARCTLAEAAPASRDYIVLAVRAGETWEFNPGPEYAIEGGTTLIIMAHPEGRQALQERLRAAVT